MNSKLSQKSVLKNYHLLDLLRGLAALSVILYHHQHFYRLEAGYNFVIEKSNQPFYTFLSYFYNNGSIAVQLFWSISGFVLALKYLQNFDSRKVFFRNRFARLYPLHFITLLLVAGLQIISKTTLGHFQIYPTNDVYHFVLNLLGVPFIGLERDYSFNGPIWSVSVEIISYLIFGLLLKYFRGFKMVPFSIFAISIVLFRVQPLNLGHSIYESFVFFFFGVITFQIYQSTKLLTRIILSIFLIVSFIIARAYGTYTILGLNQDGGISSSRLIFLLLFGGIITLLCATQELLPNPVKRIRTLTDWIGNLTYSSYLLHVPLQVLVLILVQVLKADQIAIVSSNEFLLGYLLVLIILSTFSYIYIEKVFRVRIRTLTN